MDTKINFFKIGLFVSSLFTLLVIFIFWLGKYGLEDKKYDDYSIFFSESVSGLNIGSSIKFMGFEVGTVKDIKINPYNSEEIQIDIQIQKGTPIKEDNFAILGNLGITGLKYIELKGGSNNSKLLGENQYGMKVIKSKTSALTTFVDSTEDITKEITILLGQMKKVLNDENISNFSSLLSKSEKSMANIEQFSAYLVKNEKKIDELINSMKNFANTGNSSFASVKTSADSFKELTTKIKEEFDKGTFDLKGMSSESFENLNSLLKNLENNLNLTQDLINNINESPSDLLLKQKNIKYGPGEKE
ncbi:MlaD family protein [Aliarcobacter butzleri]|uniref:ABC transporter, periplasmic substrate-binding protein, putative n=1 Tax=Aliarcobacter butzleri (strain RM4018) TaxID=367737 RepID=A8ER17_ALIB4|nr:MlaD family protein [Aliarcobacter butzleri]ABV66391.1 ABC transporter, periplasmic substrate-binding protein, putative [Aliarcobacter butzleri RM4018]MCG3660431.1 MlaD family protein [Aliarcobacter butzleri]MDK2064568.1 MlaD family protein [Aliarcobacter butzleri]MDS1314724.1 MlaD family protein [Aliarcobacter butzleri]SNV23102.1 virulence factor Mce family protein [Aliarcobacter butzleri]